MERTAEISECEQYRYALGRKWSDGPSVSFLMFNPSTADVLQDDHTIRKCIGFAERWGYGTLTVVNLFAIRSTDPKAVAKAADAVGPLNNDWLIKTFKTSHELICAWGCEDHMRASHCRNRANEVLGLAKAEEPFLDIACLGTTQGGTPRHPLMLGYNTQRIPLNPL